VILLVITNGIGIGGTHILANNVTATLTLTLTPGLEPPQVLQVKSYNLLRSFSIAIRPPAPTAPILITMAATTMSTGPVRV
jgi:hypothetical protein